MKKEDWTMPVNGKFIFLRGEDLQVFELHTSDYDNRIEFSWDRSMVYDNPNGEQVGMIESVSIAYGDKNNPELVQITFPTGVETIYIPPNVPSRMYWQRAKEKGRR